MSKIFLNTTQKRVLLTTSEVSLMGSDEPISKKIRRLADTNLLLNSKTIAGQVDFFFFWKKTRVKLVVSFFTASRFLKTASFIPSKKKKKKRCYRVCGKSDYPTKLTCKYELIIYFTFRSSDPSSRTLLCWEERRGEGKK